MKSVVWQPNTLKLFSCGYDDDIRQWEGNFIFFFHLFFFLFPNTLKLFSSGYDDDIRQWEGNFIFILFFLFFIYFLFFIS